MQRLLFTLLLVVSLVVPGQPGGIARAASIDPVVEPAAFVASTPPPVAVPEAVSINFLSPTPPESSFITSDSPTIKFSITGQPTTATYSYTLTFGGSTGPEIGCSDSSWSTPCGSQISLSSLADGIHTINILVYNGGAQIANFQRIVKIDTTPPIVTFDSNPFATQIYTNANVIIKFSGSDGSGSGINPSTFQCSLDSTNPPSFTSCTTTSSYSAPNNLSEGLRTLYVRVRDQLSLQSPLASIQWHLDKTLPTVQINNSIAATVYTSSTFTLSFDGADARSGIKEYRCSVANSLNVVVVNSVLCGSANPPGTYSFDGASLPEDNYTFKVVSIDKATNSSTPATRTIVFDKTPPDTTLTRTGLFSVTNQMTTTFNFSGSDSRSAPVTFECKVDSGAWATCTNPASVGVSGDGMHTFQVRSVDRAGNRDQSPDSFSWMLDTKAPLLSISSPVFLTGALTQTTLFTNTSDLTFIYNAIDPAPGTGVQYTCTLNNSPESCNSGQKRYPNLPEGSNTLVITAKDTANNQTSKTIQISTDYSEPQTTLLGVQSNPSNNPSPIFTFTGNDTITTQANLRFQCSLNFSSWVLCTSGTAQFTDLPDGTYSFRVRSLDQAGNFDSTPPTFTWRLDINGPETTIQNKPDPYTALTSAAFTFSGADAITGTGVIGYECQIDTNAWTSCTSPRSYNSLVNAQHTFRVRALDRAGNVDTTPDSYTWTIDTIAPPMPLITYPTTTTQLRQLAFAFNGDDNSGGSGRDRYECSLTTGSQADTWTPCTSVYRPTAGSDGSYTFKVRTVDKVGNASPPASKTITLDTKAPQAVILSPRPPTATQQITATFTFTATNLRQGETPSFTCALNGPSVQPCNGSSPSQFSNLVNGLYVFTVYATDNAGNVGATASYTWTVDTVAPDAVFIPLAPPRYRNEQRPTILFRPVADGGSPVVSFQCLLTGPITGSPRTITPCGTNTVTTTWSFTPDLDLPEGNYTLAIIPIDAAGNKDTNSPTSYTWTIERQAPDTEPISRSPADLFTTANIFTLTFALSGTEPLTPTFECWLDNSGWLPCTSPFITTPLDTGKHSFVVRAKDAAGNVDPTPPSTFWTVDRTGPTVSITNTPLKATNNPTATFVFTATDNLDGSGFANAQCRIDNGVWAACNPSGVTFSNLIEGSHTFHVQAVDKLGNPGAAITYSWVVDLTAPETIFTGLLPDRITVQQITLQFTGTDTLTADGMKFECSLDNRPFEDCLSPRTFPGLTNGPHNLRVRARDGAGNVDSSPAQHAWIVEVLNARQSIFLPLIKK